MFDHLIESSESRPHRSAISVVVSVFVHGILIVGLVLVPLIYYESLPEFDLITYLAGPSMPQPPPPPPPDTAPPDPPEIPLRTEIFRPEFVAPNRMPNEIPLAPEFEDLRPEWRSENRPRNSSGAWIGGFEALPERLRVAAPPPPTLPVVENQGPIRVSSQLQTSRLIYRVNPVYPRIALRIRLEGSVELQAIIDEEGRVSDLKVMSGLSLFVKEAKRAVSQWRYTPTILNGKPVPVMTNVTVNFKLRR